MKIYGYHWQFAHNVVKYIRSLKGETMPKFFVKTNQIEENKIKIIDEDVKHINQVLRAKVGEELTICNLDTTLNYITTISQITPEYVMCDIQDCIKSFVESKVHVTIFQGLPKADKMEYIIQKSTELGAVKIVPVEMVRCVVKLDNKKEDKKIERWQKIAESAAKQSGRDLIPKVEMPININDLCKMIKDFDAVILAYEEEKENTLKNELKKLNKNESINIGVIIGPEGGIDKSEIEKLANAGAKVVTLGKRILRTETASLNIISNIMYMRCRRIK